MEAVEERGRETKILDRLLVVSLLSLALQLSRLMTALASAQS